MPYVINACVSSSGATAFNKKSLSTPFTASLIDAGFERSPGTTSTPDGNRAFSGLRTSARTSTPRLCSWPYNLSAHVSGCACDKHFHFLYLLCAARFAVVHKNRFFGIACGVNAERKTEFHSCNKAGQSRRSAAVPGPMRRAVSATSSGGS